jgi:hypothetical protein
MLRRNPKRQATMLRQNPKRQATDPLSSIIKTNLIRVMMYANLPFNYILCDTAKRTVVCTTCGITPPMNNLVHLVLIDNTFFVLFTTASGASAPVDPYSTKDIAKYNTVIYPRLSARHMLLLHNAMTLIRHTFDERPLCKRQWAAPELHYLTRIFTTVPPNRHDVAELEHVLKFIYHRTQKVEQEAMCNPTS